MLPRLVDPNFREAARFCGFCRDYCEENKVTNDNVYSRQALVYLGCIKNSAISISAEESCKQCDYKSARIMDFLSSYGINI